VSKTEKITLYWPRGLFFWKPKAKYAEGNLLDGKRHGRWIFWYRSGQKQLEGEYTEEGKTGIWVKWDECGTKIVEGTFFHGKMHGRWIDWYVNGQKAQESHWYLGKRDGKWTCWNMYGIVEKVENHDHRHETERGYSIHTDLEARDIIRQVQKKMQQRNWEMLVGRLVGSLVKPWHVACWILVFVPALGLIRAKTPWRGVALAGIVAFFLTSVAAWAFNTRKRG